MAPLRKAKAHYLVTEIPEKFGIDQSFVVHCIRSHWIYPAAPETSELDDEDLARIELIRDLKNNFGVNDESIPVILHLLDQVYYLRHH